MDQNNPARFLDTAYNALKANPGATGQILQAAAQGQPVGLKGLAAAAAQQNQQEVQKAMMAQNIRGPQPSVIQQLAGTSGIMGQLPSNLQLASAPTGPAPEEMPQQMMAGGGLVSFAGGGNVLPPDVIDAIQSHFAEGGDVRGFADGGYTDAAPHLIPSSWEEAVKGLLSPAPGRGRDVIEAEKKAELDAARRTPPNPVITALKNLVSPSPGNRPVAEEKNIDGILSTLGVTDFSPTGGLYSPSVLKAEPTSKKQATPTWQADPDPHTGTPATPKAPAHVEATKFDKTFDQAKVDTGTKTTDNAVDTSGIGSLGMEEARDLIAGLRGHKEMNPEIAAKLEDLQGSARTSTILQSLLGGLAGGLSNPYGGRFALGSAAAGALGGYQKGATGEEEIGRKAFDILRGYADAPAEEKAKAVDLLFGIQEKAAERQSAERIAESRGESALERLLYSEQGKNLRAQQGLGQKGEATEANIINAKNSALTQAREMLKNKIPAAAQEEVNALAGKIYQTLVKDLPSLQGTGLGGNTGMTNAGVQSGGLGSGQPLVLQWNK